MLQPHLVQLIHVFIYIHYIKAFLSTKKTTCVSANAHYLKSAFRSRKLIKTY